MAIIQGLNNLQVSEAVDWKGITTDFHLSRIRENDIQTESDIITQIHGKYMNKFGIWNLIDKYPVKYFERDADYRWFLRGDMDKAIPVLSFVSSDLTRPGVNKQIFTMTVAQNWFTESDQLIFDDRNYSVRVMDNGVASASGGWTYSVKHMKPSNTWFIPPSLMQTSKKVSRIFNTDTHILGKSYTETHFTSPFEMRNVFSTASMKYECPANMVKRPLLIGLKSPDGKVSKNWTLYQDLVFEWQWREMLGNQLMYGEFNMNANGTYDTLATANQIIKTGAGLREQIAPAYKFYYNAFNLDLLLEIGLNLSINILPEDEREFLIATGERGMVEFSKAIEDKVGIFQPIVLGPAQRVFGTGQDLGFGGQYKSYNGPQGIKWTIMHFPEYDNAVHNRLPYKQAYSENYRFTIFNIGTQDGLPNIQRVMPMNSDKKWYVAGSVNPTGPQTGGMGASAVDGYEYYRRTSHGIMLRNPLSACEIIPNVVY